LALTHRLQASNKSTVRDEVGRLPAVTIRLLLGQAEKEHHATRPASITWVVSVRLSTPTHLQGRQLAVGCIHGIDGRLLTLQEQVQLALQGRLPSLDVSTTS
jgi:hypothetical protein